MTGNEILKLVHGGNVDMKPGDVYIMAAVVPDSKFEPITQTSNFFDGFQMSGEPATMRLAIAIKALAKQTDALENPPNG